MHVDITNYYYQNKLLDCRYVFIRCILSYSAESWKPVPV
jgi:hypothetical protein